MNLEFEAKEVEYHEALDGDLVQAHFQEFPDPYIDYSKKNAPMPPPIKYIGISANYEFYSEKPIVEWCDGKNYGGGETIRELEITSRNLKMVLKNGYIIEVGFTTDDSTFKKIQRFLLGFNQ